MDKFPSDGWKHHRSGTSRAAKGSPVDVGSGGDARPHQLFLLRAQPQLARGWGGHGGFNAVTSCPKSIVQLRSQVRNNLGTNPDGNVLSLWGLRAAGCVKYKIERKIGCKRENVM